VPPLGDLVVLDNFQKHSYPLGIIVNLDGHRFVDEGANYRNHTCAKYGREIIKQPQRTAIQVFDAKTIKMVRDQFRVRQVTKAESSTLEGLAEALEINSENFLRTFRDFNQACQPRDFNPAILDGTRTKGISPPKPNWALPLDTPPHTAIVVTCGFKLTFDGLKKNGSGEVRDITDKPIPGLFAAGELVGGLFCGNYLGGAGLMAGSVFGKISGQSAARYATNVPSKPT